MGQHMRRYAQERPAWDIDPPAEERRAELFSWAVVRRLGLDQKAHLDAVGLCRLNQVDP
jgi:hypothetical protein